MLRPHHVIGTGLGIISICAVFVQFLQLFESDIISILPMRRLRLREVGWLVWDHIARQWQLCLEVRFVWFESSGFFFKWLYWDTVYILQKCPFKMYNSVIFHIFIELDNYYYCLLLEHFIVPKRNPYTLAVTPIPPTSQPLATACLLYLCPCSFHHVALFSEDPPF